MRKGRTVIGQDVYSLAGGQRLQSVKDILVNDEHDAIVALLVDEGGLLGTSTIVPIEAVRRFGPDAVMVSEAAAVIPAASDERVAAVLQRKTSLLGTPVVTTRGERIGTIGDIYFEETSGTITGYEVSGGTIGNAMRGTSWLPSSAVQVIGPDAVIAIPEAAGIVESQVGGLQGAVDATRQRVSDALESALEPSPESEDGAGVVSEAEADPDGVLVGRRATTDVTDVNGSVVVANGQAVTLEHVQRARDEGGLDALYGTVGLERPVPVSEQVQVAVQSATETAGDLWSRFTNRLTEMTDAAGKRVDAQQTRARLDQIHDAIGRPVTKVFLDREDTVILDLGDSITHQAVQRAHDAGQLDALLASVYKGEVSFTQDELKAPTPGDSTIDQATGGATVVDELEQHAAEAEAASRARPAADAEAAEAEGAEAEGAEADAAQADEPPQTAADTSSAAEPGRKEKRPRAAA